MRASFVIKYFVLPFLIVSCNTNKKLYYALRESGPNRKELEYVLDYYKGDSLKYLAACFLIENMPGHYSYLGNEINDYYNDALRLFHSDLSPVEQRDSLLKLSKTKYARINGRNIQDIKVISSDYLIHNIESAFKVWQENPWAQHIDFDEFCEWILPYKCSEYQSFDFWRDTLSVAFSDDISLVCYDDETFNSPFKAVNIIRQELIRKIKPFGMYRESGYPMLSASTLKSMTYGRCLDYVNLGVLTYRSLGVPAMIDETPIWGRYRAGHNWYVILGEKGEELKSEWDISSVPGSTFFPYQRIPKVFRNTFSPNIERVKYIKKSSYKYPFSLFQQDITEEYFATTDVDINMEGNIRNVEKYAYVAVFSGHNEDWRIVDFGQIKKRNIHFSNLGRNILYVALVYDGHNLVSAADPFIIHSNGDIEFLKPNPDRRHEIVVKRKYYSSENVVNMRNRILGGTIQASNDRNFNSYDTILIIDSTDIPDKIPVTCNGKFRYWRYYSPVNSYGNIAELTFFLKDSTQIEGQIISNQEVNNAFKAFDYDWLTFVESENADDNWIGVDFGTSQEIGYVRIVPRGDDNDIHPGDEYHLRMWDGNMWITINKRMADDNCLEYKNIMENCLYSIHDATRGWDERPFICRNGTIEWW